MNGNALLSLMKTQFALFVGILGGRDDHSDVV